MSVIQEVAAVGVCDTGGCAVGVCDTGGCAVGVYVIQEVVQWVSV